MKIALSGVSGFVGGYLKQSLIANNHEIIEIKRLHFANLNEMQKVLQNADIIINLVGANISKRWSKSYKKELFNSRIHSTNLLVEAMKNMKSTPKLFINSSAVGIYKQDEICDENSNNFADDFLANLVKNWEMQAKLAQSFTKVKIVRFGIVLGKGGMMKKLLPLYKLNLGAKLGSGKQKMSWIDIDDLCEAMNFIIKDYSNKIYNFVNPQIVSNENFHDSFAKVLNRFAIFTVPKFLIKLIFGEASEVILSSIEAKPANLIKEGFKFKYNLNQSLQKIIKEDK